MSLFSSRNRSGFAARASRGRWRGGYVKRELVFSQPDTQKYPLGQLLQTIRKFDLGTGYTEISPDVGIKNCQYIASYNWLGHETPTIVVPGKPPQWTPLQSPQQHKEDDGQYFRDPNAAKYPEYPIAPAVQAIMDVTPDFKTADVDLFACGSTLGNLLRFVRGVGKPFRFSVETIGSTIFFIRKDGDPMAIIPGVRGFGHSFPEANTSWEHEVRGSETHQRIIQYELGSLKCLVRFESDGYIKEKASNGVGTGAGETHVKTSDTTGDEDALLEALQGTTISRTINTAPSLNTGLVVKHEGSRVPQSAVFDLKTRSGKLSKEMDMNDIYPLLWIKQIPNFIIAYHDGAGLFSDIRVRDVKADVDDWERENSDAIRRLSVLLDKIIEIAKKDTRGLLEAYFSGQGGLEIRSQFGEGAHALPVELMDKWAAGEPESAYTDSDPLADDGYGQDDRFDSDSEWKDDLDFEWEADSDDDEPDYTTCSTDDCGHCGKCTY